MVSVRRPLFMLCIFIVSVFAVLHLTGITDRERRYEAFLPPDRSPVTVSGRVRQADSGTWILTDVSLFAPEAAYPAEAAYLSGSAAEAPPVGARSSAIQLPCDLMVDFGSPDMGSFSASGVSADGSPASGIPIGSTVTLRGTFRSFSHADNPGEFDFADYYYGLGRGGRIRDAKLLWTDGRADALREALRRLREHWRERLYQLYPEREASILADLLLGDRSGLDPEVKALYQENGIAHILSISGLHIAILGLGLFSLLRRAGLLPHAAAPIAAAFLLLYGILTGMSVSAARAIFMFALRMLALLLKRTPDAPTSLALAAVALLFRNPCLIANSSFLLSFGSAAAVLAVIPAMSELFFPDSTSSGPDGVPIPARRTVFARIAEAAGDASQSVIFRGIRRLLARLGKSLRDSFIGSLSITLGTLPVQLFFFYEVPVYAVLLNLIILPFMSLLLFTGLVSMLLPGLGFVGTVSYLVLKGFEAVCLFGERLPHHLWNPGRPGTVRILLYYLLLGALCLFVHPPSIRESGRSALPRLAGASRGNADIHLPHGPGAFRRLALRCPKRAGCLAVCLLLLIFAVHLPSAPSAAFLSVGQGDGIVLRTGGIQFGDVLLSGDVYLFDGGSTSRSASGQYVLKPYLKYCGIRRIDAVFLSHPDADHVNGTLELLQNRMDWNLEIGAVYVTKQFAESGTLLAEAVLAAAGDTSLGAEVPVYLLCAGDAWMSGKAEFTCLHPDPSFSGEDANAASECFLVRFAPSGESLLLTGDVQGDGESALTEALAGEMRRFGLSGITVLKIAHHGSKNSTYEAFLETARPQLGIVSAGLNNRYGHPHAETLTRLSDAGCTVIGTPECGAVEIRFRRRGIQVRTFRGRRNQDIF